jgi:hypothetical protein
LFHPIAAVTVMAPNGLDFQATPNPLTEMGSGTVQLPSESSSTFTITNSSASTEFVFDGYNFTYDQSGNVTGGTITAIHEFDATGTNPIENFTGQFDAVSWIAGVKQDAEGNDSPLKALVSPYNFTFTGGPGPGSDSFGGAGYADTQIAGAGNDTLDPGQATGGAHTLTGGTGSDTFVYQQGYGAVTITNFDQDSLGNFSQSKGDLIQLNGFSGQPTITYVNGNTIADFGNGDVLTLLNVNPANLIDSDFSHGNGGGSNGGGPTIINANNSVTYTETPVYLDPAIAIADTTGTIISANASFTSGKHTGDSLTVSGVNLPSGFTLSVTDATDGTITDTNDGRAISYHFDGNATRRWPRKYGPHHRRA